MRFVAAATVVLVVAAVFIVVATAFVVGCVWLVVVVVFVDSDDAYWKYTSMCVEPPMPPVFDCLYLQLGNHGTADICAVCCAHC